MYCETISGVYHASFSIMSTPVIQYFPPPLPHAKIPPLSSAARVGNLLFVSGTPGYDENMQLDDSFAAQFTTALRNLRVIFAQAGASIEHIVKINVFLTRPGDIAEMNRLYGAEFGPAPYPARTTVIVAALPDSEMLVELDCVVDMPD
jgi:2-iminobutanoate/2-iminopropanoate deaminase